MAIVAVARVVLVVLLCVGAWADEKYSVPEPTIQVFSPKGFRATIPDAPGVVYFLVEGQLLRAGSVQKEDFHGGETGSSVELDGKKVWVVDLPDVKLKKGDIIEYLAFVAVNTDGYIKDSLRYTVDELETNYVPLPKSTYVYGEEAAETTTARPPGQPTGTTTARPPGQPTETTTASPPGQSTETTTARPPRQPTETVVD